MKYLALLWSNLKRKKLRTLLTFGCILVAFFLFGVLGAVNKAFNAGIDLAGNDRLVARHKVSIIQSLPESYEARIAQIPGVVAVTHASWFGGVYQDPKLFFPRIAVEPGPYLDMYPEIALSPEQKEAWLRTRTGAIAGRELAKRFDWKVGDRIPIQGTIWRQPNTSTWEFDLVGIYDAADKNVDLTTFFFRYDYLDEARERGKGLVGWYIMRVNDPEQSAQVAEAIDATFANSPYETKTATEKAFVQAFAKQVGDTAAIIRAVLAAVFFILLLVVGNTMAQAVRERVGEIGLLKAIGFTDGQVLGLVLAEAWLLAVAGGAVGLGLAWLFTAGGDPTGGALPVFYIPTVYLVGGVVLMLLFGLITGIVPALQAMRLRVAAALRRE